MCGLITFRFLVYFIYQTGLLTSTLCVKKSHNNKFYNIHKCKRQDTANKNMEYLNKDVILIGTASSLFLLLIRNMLIRERDKRNSRLKVIDSFTLFANNTIASLEDFNIRAVDTINNSLSAGTAIIAGLCRVINKRKVVAITKLWEQYKHETFYNDKLDKKIGKFVYMGTSDEEQRKKAIHFLNKIIDNIRPT